MKSIFTFCSLFFASTFLYAQDGSIAWAKQLGAGSSYSYNSSLVKDAAGNIYLAGSFDGTLDFNPDPLVNNFIVANGKTDICVSKFDANGNFLWVKHFGGVDNEYAYAIALDQSGNIYVGGNFSGTADFNPDPIATSILTSAGDVDNVIIKLDASGNFIWAKQIGGIDDETIFSIAVDGNQNVYVAGDFYATSDFDPNPAVHFDLTSVGGYDGFVCKLDVSGNLLWAKQFGGTLDDHTYYLDIDGSGNVYTTGRFKETADLDPGAGTSLFTSAGSSDIFISKLDASGNFVWAKQMGGIGSDGGTALLVNATGIYVTGTFNETADLNSDPLVINNFTSAGYTDIFICKLDAAGNTVWAKQIGGESTDYSAFIAADPTGNLYLTGDFRGTMDFDTDPVVTNELTSNGGHDIFITKLTEAGNFVWAKNIGGLGDDDGSAIATDASENIYTIGQFMNEVDFDPGAGEYPLTALGNQDIFLSKLNASGDFVFAKQTGSGVSSDYAAAITTDASGNSYTTGNFRGTADFNPDPSAVYNLTSPNFSRDIYISKLNASGNFVWAKNIGNDGDEYGISIATDATGNVYATGYFKATVDFNPDPLATEYLTSNGYEDVYIIKFDPAGNFVWVKQIGGISPESVTSITVDGSGNVYTIGTFANTVDFNPDPLVTNNLTSANDAIFISKLDASGNYVWAKQINGSSSLTAYSIKIDASGNPYICGGFFGTVDFNPDPVVTNNLTSFGSSDIFISKLDASGNFVWVKQLGGASIESALSISVDATGNVYTTGYFRGTADFDPDITATYNLVSNGGLNEDIFVSKLDASGNFVWAKKLGGTQRDIANSIAVDAASKVYITGYFAGVADFNPDATGVYNLTSVGADDIFISKLDATGNFVWAKNIGSISYDVGSSLTLNNDGELLVTGSFTGLADFDPEPAIVNNLSATANSEIFVLKINTGNTLPVTLKNFVVQESGCMALLQWKTASEQNSREFEIQQSTDGVTFKKVGMVGASGNSNVEKQYIFRFDLVTHTNYFRLRMVDKDGSSTLSSIVHVHSNCSNNFISLHPNPATENITVEGLEGENYLQIIDPLGKIVSGIKTTGKYENINVSGLPAGVYLLQVNKNTRRIQTIKFIKEN